MKVLLVELIWYEEANNEELFSKLCNSKSLWFTIFSPMETFILYHWFEFKKIFKFSWSMHFMHNIFGYMIDSILPLEAEAFFLFFLLFVNILWYISDTKLIQYNSLESYKKFPLEYKLFFWIIVSFGSLGLQSLNNILYGVTPISFNLINVFL